nr:retrovirus-related Pol polyprotein from transposon TNT 1-94 [Tanacetum cinerariifolium]
MSTQQDNYAVGSESRPPMLNKENYVPWSSRLLRYAKSRPNGKLIHNFIINGPYVRRMIPKPGDTNREVPMNETFHVQTDDELTKKELKQIEANDQAIQTILLGLPKDIHAAVDSCKTAHEIWLRVQQMMKGSDIRIQEMKAKNCTVRPRRRDAAYLQTQLLIAQKEEARIQLQAEEFDLMTVKAPVYDSDGSVEVIQICLWCVNSGCSKHMIGNLKLLINFVWKFTGTVRFEIDHVAAILGQFCDSDLNVAFRRNACFVRNFEGVDLLKGDRSTNLYTINLHEMASASPICLMAHASSTKSWLWHQRLSHLKFDTINNLAKNDLVSGLPKFKYHKEHLCPSCEQEKSKKASHPPKPVPNSRQRLHLLHMDLCGPMRIASINGKQYVLVIMDDYSRYTWVRFLRSKDEAPEVIKTFLKRITVLLQSPIIIIRTNNGT